MAERLFFGMLSPVSERAAPLNSVAQKVWIYRSGPGLLIALLLFAELFDISWRIVFASSALHCWRGGPGAHAWRYKTGVLGTYWGFSISSVIGRRTALFWRDMDAAPFP